MKKETVPVAVGALILGFVLGIAFPKLFPDKPHQGAHSPGGGGAPSTPASIQQPVELTEENIEHMVEHYKDMLEKDPNNKDVYLSIGRVYYDAKKFTVAIEYYQKALEIDPKNKHIYQFIADAYFDSDKYQEAIDSYQKALDIDPDLTDARVDMGIMYRRFGQPEKAVEIIREAISRDPSHVHAKLNLGIILRFDMKDYPSAINAFEEFLKIAPDHPQAKLVKTQLEEIRNELKQKTKAEKPAS